ncbi:hypothetical protein KC19_VG309300 [Ceratodon purpureus]|uniref:Uncharacterized protein n=1 Tax=Ceratodon purpureus TaxID=3225 RepID=A0A8T0HWD5_CERPU|nr:hypothetical protein KC19_VG309300 [Ceratodon purpureus]
MSAISFLGAALFCVRRLLSLYEPNAISIAEGYSVVGGTALNALTSSAASATTIVLRS